jgi:hypothetical protein
MKLYDIAVECGTDKASHGFCEPYEKAMEHLHNEHIRLLEIGIKKACSMRMWQKYFPKGEIHGLDIDLSKIVGDKKNCHIVNTGDIAALTRFVEGPLCKQQWDIIIDDGGHYMNQQQTGFDILWNQVKPGGMYVMEDLQSSFWPIFNQDNQPTTWDMLNAFKNGTTFSSKFITAERFNVIYDEIDTGTFWLKRPAEDKSPLSINDSITAIIYKKL